MKVSQCNHSVERGADFEIRLKLLHAAKRILCSLDIICRRLHLRTIRGYGLFSNLQVIARNYPRSLCCRSEMLVSSLVRGKLRLRCR